MPNNNLGPPNPSGWWNRVAPRPRLVDGRQFGETGNLPTWRPPDTSGGVTPNEPPPVPLQGRLPNEQSPPPIPGYPGGGQLPNEQAPPPIPGFPGSGQLPNEPPPPQLPVPQVGLPENSIPVPPSPVTNNPSSVNQHQSPEDLITGFMESLTNRSGSYIQNARRRGREFANSRGMLNSSMGAGAGERAALEASQPLVDQMVSIQRQREQFQSQDWLNSNQFDREFAGTLAMLPVTNSYQMLQTILDYALQDPSLYTPEVFSGFSNFFMQNMQDIMSQYFPLGGNS